MRQIIDFFIMLFHMLFRHMDFPTKLRLIKIGNPDENSPVLMTGNYIYTVKRLIKILKGFDCYLLVAKSSGSNVWCAAGMGEFSEHDVVDSISFTKISDLVGHRNLILPPAASVGIDAKTVQEKTGWKIKWGPYHFKYLREYLQNGSIKSKKMYDIIFPLRDRIEMALGAAMMTSFPTLLVSIFWMGRFFLLVSAAIFFITLFNFVFFPLFPKEKFFRRSITLLLFCLFVMIGIGVSLQWSLINYFIWGIVIFGIVFISCGDMCGSTTLLKTTVAHWLKKGDYQSLFQPIVCPALCVGCKRCVEVCPKRVYESSKDKKTVVATAKESCFECLACIKQCPKDAIYNENGRVYKKDIRSIQNLDELMIRPINFEEEVVR